MAKAQIHYLDLSGPGFYHGRVGIFNFSLRLEFGGMVWENLC